MASKFHNRTLTTLYHYWRARRQGETLPGRSDIDPADLDAAVPGLLLLDVQQRPPRFRYRRVGPALADLLGADPNGLCLDEVKANPLHDQMLGGLQTCAWQRRPVLVRGSFGLPRQRDVRAGGAMVRRSIANTFSGRQLVYEMLLVPMARDGRTVDMILGAIAYQQVAGRSNPWLREPAFGEHQTEGPTAAAAAPRPAP